LVLKELFVFLAYYYQCKYDDVNRPDREIVFQRGYLEKEELFDWSSFGDRNFSGVQVNVSTEGMESSDAPYFVDFANKFIHIGCIIPSMTQEEVLFSVCPEAFVSMLICQKLGKREVVIIKNVRRYCSYSGYQYSFKFTGFYEDYNIFNILIIDACFENHFSKRNIDRDINKAYLGFLMCQSKISTGHWGCGAFGGEKVSKFLQQLIAAAIANVDLDYSTFREEENKKILISFLRL